MKERILLCEECRNMLSEEDVNPERKWGHVCRMKKYKEEHYCESYVKIYEEIK